MFRGISRLFGLHFRSSFIGVWEGTSKLCADADCQCTLLRWEKQSIQSTIRYWPQKHWIDSQWFCLYSWVLCTFNRSTGRLKNEYLFPLGYSAVYGFCAWGMQSLEYKIMNFIFTLCSCILIVRSWESGLYLQFCLTFKWSWVLLHYLNWNRAFIATCIEFDYLKLCILRGWNCGIKVEVISFPCSLWWKLGELWVKKMLIWTISATFLLFEHSVRGVT